MTFLGQIMGNVAPLLAAAVAFYRPMDGKSPNARSSLAQLVDHANKFDFKRLWLQAGY